MQLFLPPEVERFILEKVETGLYHSPSEVILHALRLLWERDEVNRIRVEELGKQIALGVEQMERGQYTVHDGNTLKEMLEQIKAHGRQRLADQNAAGSV